MSYDSILRSAMEDLSEIHEDRMARKLIELSHDDNDVDKSLLERISSYAWEQLHLGTLLRFLVKKKESTMNVQVHGEM